MEQEREVKMPISLFIKVIEKAYRSGQIGIPLEEIKNIYINGLNK